MIFLDLIRNKNNPFVHPQMAQIFTDFSRKFTNLFNL